MAIRKQLALGLLLVIATSLPCWPAEVTTWTSSLTPPATPIQVYPRIQRHNIGISRTTCTGGKIAR